MLLALVLMTRSELGAQRAPRNGCIVQQVRRSQGRLWLTGVRCTWVPERRHLARGDGEFADNGPRMTLLTRMSWNKQQTALMVQLSLDAVELRRDSTRISGVSPEYTIYSADRGMRIAQARPGPGEDSWKYVDSNYLPDRMAIVAEPTRGFPNPAAALRNSAAGVVTAGLVKEWVAVGDVRGTDVGRTYLQVYLQPIEVTLVASRPPRPGGRE